MTTSFPGGPPSTILGRSIKPTSVKSSSSETENAIALGYSRDAEQECAAFHKRTGRIIKLLTVQEILDEEHVQKM